MPGMPGTGPSRAIENGFPFEEISRIAELESWRKEVWRPVYHMHKWWAQRLGSVFRAALIGAAMPEGEDVLARFYGATHLDDIVVYDPFMGSGTTVGEAAKLGCRVVGRDINPVAYRNVKVALSAISRRRLLDLYTQLEAAVAVDLRALYRSIDASGHECDVLYWFWVKHLPCPQCSRRVDLFSDYVFARHAYVRRNPAVQVVCPECGQVVAASNTDVSVLCPDCRAVFDPHVGTVRGARGTCRACGHEFAVASTARSLNRPPSERLYAKLLLLGDGSKRYARTTTKDDLAYEAASAQLHASGTPLPVVKLEDGYNTRQAISYGYTSWDQFFNDRQLLALSLLAGGIRSLPDCPEKEALALLFSGTLEFNNMFASYKGEGTGAVRHMFAHHILKPERTPIEANLWGTPKSSGSFSTLFKSRLLRALDYKESPWELGIDKAGDGKQGQRVRGLSRPMESTVVTAWPPDGLEPGNVYLSCGDSSRTDLPDGSVDIVLTDPPFFDNVHYSELADFFFVWQQLWFPDDAVPAAMTTRSASEVQDTQAHAFASKLAGVFTECCRVLRDDGLLVFSYHHSREDGWSALATAIHEGGFVPVQAQPVKSEMSVAMPKTQAKSPIDLDMLIVCRKAARDSRERIASLTALDTAARITRIRVNRFNEAARMLSLNDVRVTLISQLMVELGAQRTGTEMVPALALLRDGVSQMAEGIYAGQGAEKSQVGDASELALFSLDT